MPERVQNIIRHDSYSKKKDKKPELDSTGNKIVNTYQMQRRKINLNLRHS